jgi:uncharacterized membrane protein YphA (DoxX/SURF4 family)
MVQRLFSMFPSGIAGAALLVLRVSVAVSLLVDGTLRWALVTSPWVLLVFLVPALLLVIGFLTPYASIVTCLVQLGVVIVTGGQHSFHLFLSIPNSLVVALIGPGAYSIDAHIFGRRLLTVPPRR